jgi:hypothetical protein
MDRVSSDLKQWLDSQAEALGEPETALSPYHDAEDDFSPKTPSAASQRPAVLSPNYKEDRYLWHEDGKDDYPQMDLARQAYRSGLPAGPTLHEQVVQSLQQDGPATREELAARLGIDEPSWKMLSYAIGAGKRSGEVYEENGILQAGVRSQWETQGNVDPRLAAKTRTQLVNQAEGLSPDTSEVVHEWPDGWTVRRLKTYSDAVREGELMRNCLSPEQAFEMADRMDNNGGWEPENVINEAWLKADFETDNPNYSEFNLPDDIFSLRDPDNIPHVTEAEGSSLGRNNSIPKQEYQSRMDEWRGVDSTDALYNQPDTSTCETCGDEYFLDGNDSMDCPNCAPAISPKITKEFARDLSLKLLAVAMEEEAKEEKQKESMAASPEAWEDASRTRSWYHGTPSDRVEKVLAEGLLPGQEGDWDGSYMAPRPGHVYLTSDPTEAKMRGSGKTEDMPYTTVLQIDPSYLDPANMSPDEDLMSDDIKRDHGIGYMRDDAQYKSVGDLAEGLGWGDDTSVTDPYVRRGSPLAYRGVIPPEALSVYKDPEEGYSDCMYCGEYTSDDDGAYCGECGMNKYAKTAAGSLPEVVYIDTPAQYKSWLAAEAPWIYDQENNVVYAGKAYQRHADIAGDIPEVDMGVHGVIKLHVPDKPLFVVNDMIDVPDTVRQALANWSGKDIRSEWPGYEQEFNALYDEAFGKPHHLTSVLDQTEVQEQEEDSKDEESSYEKSKRLWYDGVWREVTPASSEGLEHEE